MRVRLQLFLIFVALALAALAALLAGLWLGYHHLAQAGATLAAVVRSGVMAGFVQAGVVSGFALLGLMAGVWLLLDMRFAKPIDQLAGDLRARVHGDVTAALPARQALHLGDLGPAARAASDSLAQTRSALAEAVARETARLSGENARLGALLADVPAGVLLCSADHRIVFYNGLGVGLLRAIGPAGLGRSLFDYLHAGPLQHAYGRLCATGDADAASDLLCSTRAGARVLAARMRLLQPEAGAAAGYVLTLQDVTADLNAAARREALVVEMFDRFGRPAANLATLIEALPNPALPPDLREALQGEVARLGQAVTELSQRHDQSRGEDWPLMLTRASDLLDGVAAQVAGSGLLLSQKAAPLLLHCNGFEVIGLLALLVRNLPARRFHLSLEEDGSDALLRLSWQGEVLALADLEAWLAQPIDPAMPEISGRAVLVAHATDIWPETTAEGAALCLPLRVARRETARPDPVLRDVVYDFDLLSGARNASVAEARLDALTYVVFDSETTGLLPDQGDEVVQIAAVRIVNGRRLKTEVFDMLVNPQRKIPAASTKVHGITDAMVADAPPMAEVARRLHDFAAGAVLIAHNAPFDMQFLRRIEGQIGLRFDNPILDTVLLSAVIWGQHETHTLDALTHRLGITIPEEARHTALGDAIATADAFLKLLPMLQGRGLTRFDEVLTQVRQHGRLLKDLN